MARQQKPSTVRFYRELANIHQRAVATNEPLLNVYYRRALQPGTTPWQRQACLRYASLAVRNPLVLDKRVRLTAADETVQ